MSARVRCIEEGACGRPPAFRALLSLALLVSGCTPAACPLPAERQPTAVRHVIDGDTVILADGRHLRLVGINTPEIGREGRAHQPGALAASQALQRLIAAGDLSLALAPERFDRHRRLLGDLYTGTRSVQEHLVETGLALAVAVPPNTAQAACLFAAEARARTARRGLWADAAAWTLEARLLAPDFGGFARIRGTITGRRETRAGIALELDERLELWVPRAAEPRMADALAGLAPGTRLTVRGWVGRFRGRPNLRLEHPAMLETGP